MSLRLPSPREIADLFFTPSDVAGAVAMLERAKLRVTRTSEKLQRLSDQARQKAADALAAHISHSEAADDHTAEASRAARVATRLTELLA